MASADSEANTIAPRASMMRWIAFANTIAPTQILPRNFIFIFPTELRRGVASTFEKKNKNKFLRAPTDRASSIIITNFVAPARIPSRKKIIFPAELIRVGASVFAKGIIFSPTHRTHPRAIVFANFVAPARVSSRRKLFLFFRPNSARGCEYLREEK